MILQAIWQANLFITLRPGLGIYANIDFAAYLTAVVVTLTSLNFGVPTLHTSGVASIFTTWYYHINRFFVQSPNSSLYVGIYDESPSSDYAFPEVGSMQAFANGSIRQLGVYIPTGFISMSCVNGYITAIEAQIKTLISTNQPLSAIVGTDFTNLGNGAAALTDLSGLNSEHVSLVIGQDGAAQGAGIFYAQGFSVTQLGDILGLVSVSQVSDDIAWVATYTFLLTELKMLFLLLLPDYRMSSFLTSRGTINR